MTHEIKRTVNSVRNPKWMNEAHTLINCEVDFGELDEVYVGFTASPDDITTHGKQIFADCAAGNYGEVAEFDADAYNAKIAEHNAAVAAANEAKDAARAKLKTGTPLTNADLEALGLI